MHVAKYQGGAVGPMLAHYERKPEIERGYRRPNIDQDRTHSNYNLGPDWAAQGLTAAEAVGRRINSLRLKRSPRKDAVRLCDCVVTAPRDLPRERCREFFAAASEALAGRYGADNVVSAWVHMDEATPHMHWAWVPVTPDGRLSAKDVVSRKDLKTLHPDIEREVSARMGCQVHLLLDDEDRGAKELSRLDQADYRAAKDRLAAEQAKAEAAAALRALTEAADVRHTARATAMATVADKAEARRDKAQAARNEALVEMARANGARNEALKEVECLQGEADWLNSEVDELGRQADYEEHRAAEAEARRMAAEAALEDARKRLELVQERKRKEDEKARALGVREASARKESDRFAMERKSLREMEGRAERDCKGLRQRIKEQVRRAFALVRDRGYEVVERCAEAVGVVRGYGGRWAPGEKVTEGVKVATLAFLGEEKELKSEQLSRERDAGGTIVNWGAMAGIGRALADADALLREADAEFGPAASSPRGRVEREDDWDLGL